MTIGTICKGFNAFYNKIWIELIFDLVQRFDSFHQFSILSEYQSKDLLLILVDLHRLFVDS